jgi:hypothetical protein
MKNPWHKADPNLLEQLKAEIERDYPNLHFFIEGDIVFARGSFPISHEGRILDRYQIEIEFPHDYPESLPIVRETGGRIPRTADYHINSNTAEVCLFVPDERWWVLPPGSTFLEFLNGPVRNFFLGQSLVEIGQPWPFGQWLHGADGILEFYTRLLGTNELTIILKYLEYLIKPVIKGHWNCPCGSGKRLRQCHSEQLWDLRNKIPSNVAAKSLQSLIKKI